MTSQSADASSLPAWAPVLSPPRDRARGQAGRDPRRRAETDPFDRALFLRSVRAGGLQDRGAAVRNADRMQERGRDQVGRFRRVRYRRRDARRGGRRTGRGDRLDLQSRHGDHRKEGRGHRLDQGSQGQARRGVSRHHAGSVLPGAAADGRHDHQGRRAGARLLQRDAYRAVARRHRRLCRRRARPRRVALERHRPAGRISLFDARWDRSTWCSAPIAT